MKILELLERLIEPEHTTQKYRGEFHGRINRPPRDKGVLGHGAFSVVRDDPKDAHMVKKSHYRPMGTKHPRFQNPETDGFDSFAEYLIKNDINDNIHLPRVYSAKKIEDKHGHTVSKYQIERLESLKNLPDDAILTIAGTHFEFSERYLKNADRYEIIENMASRLSNAVLYPYGSAGLRIDSLKDAVRIIAQILDATDRHLDIHGNNIMARRTPHGLQLVITDPMS